MTGAAEATSDPSGVSLTLQGCRLPSPFDFGTGPFICPDADYTTGNLGKNWNELDLVPFRITAQAGNSAPASQTYAVAIALDNQDGGDPGFDVLSTLTKNSASDASCSISVGAQTTLTPGVGGTNTSIYRILTITQAKSSTCVYDFYGRLALGSHLFPGASLHADLLNQAFGTSGIGAKDVSIPVNQISPQEFTKTMSATEGGSFGWDLQKGSSPTSVNFGDVCANGAPTTEPVAITVTWTKVAQTPGDATIIVHIRASNPASRTLSISGTDNIYTGTDNTGTLLDSRNFGPVTLPADTANIDVLSFTLTLPNSQAGLVGAQLNDVATATYSDPVVGDSPGTATATALTTIDSGSVSDASATVTDSESITGASLKFSVATPTPSSGSFTGGYTSGTQTTGPVGWTSGTNAINSSGSVEFDKTIYLSPVGVTSGTLSDTAQLTTSDTNTTKSASVDVNITSTASGTLTISKTIPALGGFLNSGDRIDVYFSVKPESSVTSQPVTITFNYDNVHCTAGVACTQTAVLSGLTPDNYIVTESPNAQMPLYTPAGCGDSSCQSTLPLAPDGSNPLTVDLTADATHANCTGVASFNNVLTAANPKAAVIKVTQPTLTNTDPNRLWDFQLTDPNGGTVNLTNVDSTNLNPPTFFLGDLTIAGTYTVVETTSRTGWNLTEVDLDGTPELNTSTCTFDVSFPASLGHNFVCTFTNTENGSVQVTKTVSGSPPSGQSFTFELLSGADATHTGTVLETETADSGNGGVINFTTSLAPNTHYQMCEQVMPGWNTNLPNPFVPGIGTANLPNPDISNELVCSDFEVTPGQTFQFAVDNSPPPGGLARTIGFWKNWASCSNSGGHQAHILDETLFDAHSITISDPTGMFPGFFLVDSSLDPETASDCQEAVDLLSKSPIGVVGKKHNARHHARPNARTNAANDPAFNLAAQLLAALLNVQAGAAECGSASTAILNAQTQEGVIHFNGLTHTTISATEAALLNNLATTLDLYNNNLLCQ